MTRSRHSFRIPRSCLGLLALSLSLACGDGDDGAGGAAGGGGGEDAQTTLISRGRHYYHNVCIACHNGDPTRDGTLGPALAGVSLDVIEAKVMRGEYPEGYTPRRNTSTMPAFAYLEPELPGIAAYLATFEPPE